MKTEQPAPVSLAQYQPFPFEFETVNLCFDLDENATKVVCESQIRRIAGRSGDLVLDGENMELLRVLVDGQQIPESQYQLNHQQLVLFDLPEHCLLTIETQFSPAKNHALNGLYMSAGRFCTQCEAQGFRNITYFADRPDVMSRFTVRIQADTKYETLLSNGNLLDQGLLPDGRHFALWEDPFKKPAYLFALVAGNFEMIEDSFTTLSGKTVPLQIYVDPGDAHLANYAMDALKRSMKWDEEVFGREYDLDLFMIVAVRSFNFGAMENKGLNIFNSSVLLADAATATDADFERIESVVAHEYFHNWTGNRITCRDWFQLCLKEGLTVFRDQEFSSDMRGRAITRIKNVKTLRARQFPEDSGPLAHPVRPQSYLSIDNFYTATVYEKGAELIRCLKTIIGDEHFAQGMDRYFEVCDGTAATMEQFIDCFAHTSGQDLSRFLRWYGQAGRPTVTIDSKWDNNTQSLRLTVSQKTEPTPGEPTKQNVPIPVRIGLLGETGPLTFSVNSDKDQPIDETVLLLERQSQNWTLYQLDQQPIVSAFRQLSAPVTFEIERNFEEHALLIANDPDLFTRWDEAQSFGRKQLMIMTEQVLRDEIPCADEIYLSALTAILNNPELDPAFIALCLQPPSEDEIFQLQENAVPEAIAAARSALLQQIAQANAKRLLAIHSQMRPTGKFSPDAKPAGLRAIANQALITLSYLKNPATNELLWQAWQTADSMTDTMATLVALDICRSEKFHTALEQFYTKWRQSPLVIDKWFSLQAISVQATDTSAIRKLLQHSDFDTGNPNRARAIYGAFSSANLSLFHAKNGDGYALLAEGILQIDQKNPALAARLMGAFSSWKQVEPKRRELARSIIENVRNTPNLSKNTFEIASKHLAQAD